MAVCAALLQHRRGIPGAYPGRLDRQGRLKTGDGPAHRTDADRYGSATMQPGRGRDGGLFTSLFMAGLVGGWSHCAGMCGPFVLAQVATRLEGIPASRMTELHRLTGAAVLPYHFGRATTYAGIGGTGALLAGGAASLPGLRWLSVALLGFAALFFLSYAVGGLVRHLPKPQAPGFACGRSSAGPSGSAASPSRCSAARPVGAAMLWGWRWASSRAACSTERSRSRRPAATPYPERWAWRLSPPAPCRAC